MRPTNRSLVGRDEELTLLVEALGTPEVPPGTTVLCGDAGIGKTSLWLAGIDAAATMGYRIVSARPSEAETGFSFSGLGDLLREDADTVLPHLSPIQRRALETALLLGDSGAQVDARGVAAAFLAAVCRLAADGPFCVAVDDVQWLDAESLGVIRYALARLDAEPIAGLFAIRGALPDWLRRAVPEDRLRTVEVVGLSLGATHGCFALAST